MTISNASTDPAISLLADLIHQKTGLFYDSNRFDLLADRLAPLVYNGRFNSLKDYYYYLKYDEQTGPEWERLQSALAVNETYFWREFDHIRAVTEIIVPQMQLARPGMPVRIWHAACASGEEPYTMAIALTETGCYQRGPIHIMASDFNRQALENAQAGLYRQRAFRSIPADIWNRYFSAAGAGQYLLDESIKERVTFSYLNLLDESVMAGIRGFDIIFCRNVFIYFSDQAVRSVAGWFYQTLEKSGYLFVGTVESLLRLTSLYELVEVGSAFAYQKRSAAAGELPAANEQPAVGKPPAQGQPELPKKLSNHPLPALGDPGKKPKYSMKSRGES